jgi:hypothetical protein
MLISKNVIATRLVPHEFTSDYDGTIEFKPEPFDPASIE